MSNKTQNLPYSILLDACCEINIYLFQNGFEHVLGLRSILLKIFRHGSVHSNLRNRRPGAKPMNTSTV